MKKMIIVNLQVANYYSGRTDAWKVKVIRSRDCFAAKKKDLKDMYDKHTCIYLYNIPLINKQ